MADHFRLFYVHTCFVSSVSLILPGIWKKSNNFAVRVRAIFFHLRYTNVVRAERTVISIMRREAITTVDMNSWLTCWSHGITEADIRI